MAGEKKDKASKSGDLSELSDLSCGLCGESFGSCKYLRSHCGTPKHRFVLASDEEHSWKHRPPPPLHCVRKKELSICQSHRERGQCPLGELCCEAHGEDELKEWRERLEFRRAKVKEAHNMPPEGYQAYASDLLWRYSNAMDASAMQRIMTGKLHGTQLACKQPLHCTVSSEETELLWDFELHTVTRLQRLVLLRDGHRGHFALRRLRVGAFNYNLPVGAQEWVSNLNASGGSIVYHIQVAFQASTYGTFRQTLVLDFGGGPVLARHLTVDAAPPDVVDVVESSRRLIPTSRGRWSSTTVDVIPFTEGTSASAQSLYDMFLVPDPEVFQLTQSVVGAAELSRDNYKARMHELLYIEEMARADIIARFNGRATLGITANPAEGTYAQGGELFACMPLATPVTEDTEAGRLVLRSCSLVWLSLVADRGVSNGRRKVFELPIHSIQKRCVYVRLTKRCVQKFGLKPQTSFEAEVQFQLERLPFCRTHYAVQRLPTTSLVVPDFRIQPSPCPPEWEHGWDPRLSQQQRQAVAAIVSPSPAIGVAPVLVEGPCGTGKTFVLAQALFAVIRRRPDARVLVCTHSDSAADLFVLDYLAKEVPDRPTLRPLRLVDEFRMPDNVDHRLLPFCLEVPQDQQFKEGPWFRQPTNQELEEYQVVVTTLLASELLMASGLKRGSFTHIFIDEATQAMEAECLLPLALADETTRIVLAGDCMQLSPEVFSPFARDRRLHASFLERLCPPPHPPLRDDDHEPPPPPVPHPCRITLTDNFRSHEALADFVSDAFYGGRLRAAVASSDSAPQPHPQFYPLSFFAVRGVDQDQDGTSTSFCNQKEVGEVCSVVKQLAESWPKVWGPCDLATIAVVTPYHDQVQYIREKLRDQRLARVRVETVTSVQGKEFRAVILSTVRARATCLALERAAAKGAPEGAAVLPLNFGFLSDTKALNTALARAQSLVAVVGDPITLCSVGACRSVWEKFVTTCTQNGSLHHMGWKETKSVLDTLERQRESDLQLEEKISLRHPLLTRKFETRPSLTRDASPIPTQPARHASGPPGNKFMSSHFQSMLLDDDDDGDNGRGDPVGRGDAVLRQEAAVPASQPQPSRPSLQSASRVSSSQPKKQFHEDRGRAASAGQSLSSLGNGMPHTKKTGTVADRGSQPHSQPLPRSRPSCEQSPSSQPQKQFHKGGGRAASEGRTSNPSGNGIPRTKPVDKPASGRLRSQPSSHQSSYSRPASAVGRGAAPSPEFRSRGNLRGAKSSKNWTGGCGRSDHTAACKGGPQPPEDRPDVAYVSVGGEGVTWEKRRLSRDDGSSSVNGSNL